MKCRFLIAFLLCSFLAFHSNLMQAQADAKSQMAFFIEKANQARKAGNMDSVRINNLAALKYYQDDFITDDSLRWKYWIGVAGSYISSGLPDSGHYWVDQAIVALEESADFPSLLVDALTNKGTAHIASFENELAIGYLSQALELARNNGLKDQQSRLLNNLGVVYRRLSREIEATSFYEEALTLRRGMNDSMGVANVLFNLSNAYVFMERYDTAVHALDEAINLFRDQHALSDVANCQIAMGRVLIRQGNYAGARVQLDSAMASPSLKLVPKSYVTLFLSLAEINVADKKYKEAEKNLNQIQGLIEKLKLPDIRVNYYDVRRILAEQKGNYKKAVEYTYLKEAEVDQYNAFQNQQLRREMEERFLSKEKSYEISLLEKEATLLEIENRAANRRNIFFAGIIALLIGLIAVGYFLFRKFAKQKAAIEKANADKELLLKEIHHRVKNNLQVVSALLTLQSKFIKDEHVQQALLRGNNRIESMALIHKDLYQHDNLKGVHAPTYFNKLVDSLTTAFVPEDFQLHTKLEIAEVWIDVDTMVPLALLTNELLMNVFKHAFEGRDKGQLSVMLHEKNQGLQLQIQDDGVGAGKEAIAKGDSFGHALVQAFARKLDATIDTVNSHGLCVNLLIKKYKTVAQ